MVKNNIAGAVDRVVVSALICALAALGVLGWHFWQSRNLDSAGYQKLALTQLQGGQPEAAQQTCELAISKKFDGEAIRHLLLQAMYAQNNAAGVTAQLEWGRHHPDSLRLHVDEISIALSRGEIQHAHALLTQLRAKQYPPGLTTEYQSALTSIAKSLAEAGLTSESLALLESLPEAAKRIPEILAAQWLAKGQPQKAVDTLGAALPFDGLSFGPAYLRGEASMALGKVDLAQTEFHKITDHAYIDPLSNEHPLALLASARAYVLQNQNDKAREQFERLFDLWKNADADFPLLQAARAEYDSSTALDVTLKP